MNHPLTRRHPQGYASMLTVSAVSATLLTMMLFAYNRAVTVHATQSAVQIQTDYAEKEDALLRALVTIAPNRAMRAMQNGSNATAARTPLGWDNIFADALTLANARQSISTQLRTNLGSGVTTANSGDSAMANVNLLFKAVGGETGLVSPGINRSLGTGWPVPLSNNDTTESTRDKSWPIISSKKIHGTLAQAGVSLPVTDYPNHNVMAYPNLNFGYAQPGQPFVTKRNWWAFSMDLAAHDTATTGATQSKREFVLAIYEIPSQLAVSAASFMNLGTHASGQQWANTTISGSVFASKADVAPNMTLPSLATRRGATLGNGATVGGKSFDGDPMAPGVRELYQLTEGTFFPVSMASEGGRAAFIPINRGADFLDRFAHGTETNSVSSTTWNQYSVGALQCAMRLDIAGVKSATDKTPTKLRFSYLKGGTRQSKTISLETDTATGLPAGYIYACAEDQTYNFGTATVDVAYGKNGTYGYQYAVTGSVTFNNARFGDPFVGVVKEGYFKPSYPFEVRTLASGQRCVAIYPQRFAAFLAVLGADATAVNHSLAVNVDYTAATGSTFLAKPSIPCTDLDYGLIVDECTDMRSFTKGFSLVTNLRLFYADDFNAVPGTPPTGFTPVGDYFPPCSVFAPERRFGTDVDPLSVEMTGQLGTLASEDSGTVMRPLDVKKGSGTMTAASQITANFRPITHPAELPPITMMNWLVVISERRAEYVGQ